MVDTYADFYGPDIRDPEYKRGVYGIHADTPEAWERARLIKNWRTWMKGNHVDYPWFDRWWK